jgi:hypothetical protein
VLSAVSAEIIRPRPSLDAACQEVFDLLGWKAERVKSPEPGTARTLRYRVTSKSGRKRMFDCVQDAATETVLMNVVR